MAKPPPITTPAEPIGSIPRPVDLIERISRGDIEDPNLEPSSKTRFEAPFSALKQQGLRWFTDGEQRKYQNFATYAVHGLSNNAPDVFKIPSSHSHMRRLPRLTRGPFRYRRYADSYLDVAMRCAHVPVKQVVISETGSSGFVGVTAPVVPALRPPEEVCDTSFQPGKNWRWC